MVVVVAVVVEEAEEEDFELLQVPSEQHAVSFPAPRRT